MGKAVTSNQQHVSCGAVVYRKRDRVVEVLALYRAKTDSWHLPKGTQERNESIEETASREILEETGYPVAITRYLGSLESTIERPKGMIPKLTHYFAAQLTSGAPTTESDAEHDAVRFVPIEELKNLLREKRVKNFEKEHLILEIFLESGILS